MLIILIYCFHWDQYKTDHNLPAAVFVPSCETVACMQKSAPKVNLRLCSASSKYVHVHIVSFLEIVQYTFKNVIVNTQLNYAE